MNNSFSIITAESVKKIFDDNPHEIYNLVKASYLRHGEGKVNNPPSYFLSFPDKPKSRIIALPSLITKHPRIAGIKWISSNPDNINNSKKIKRASAVIILNDYETGYPIACIEGSIISALRTVYSAVLIADSIKSDNCKDTVGIVGAGNISLNFLKASLSEGWPIKKVCIYDINNEPSLKLKNECKKFLQSSGKKNNIEITIYNGLDELIKDSNTVFLSTTAKEPYILKKELFKHNPLVLNVSLRDISPEIILSSNNIVDDIDHVLNAKTSPDLAYQKSKNKDFINCSAHELINGYNKFSAHKPIIFSPMGMGILDLILANYVYEQASKNGFNIQINNFFD